MTPKTSKFEKHISQRIGKAIGDYNLISDNDKILVAVSGGKDSLTLLKQLKERQKWVPVKYNISAAHIKTDFACSSCTHNDVLEKLFTELDVDHTFKSVKVLDENKKTNCFWCSWNKRKALFEIAKDRGCNKIAFGHHKDDIIETTLLNIFFQGKISSMNPKQELFGGEIVLIRPLCYVEEEIISAYAQESHFPSKLCKCPHGKTSQRKIIKKIIKEIESNVPGTNIKTNIFKSISRIKEDYLCSIKI